MNCQRRQPENRIKKPSQQAHQHDFGAFERIQRILAEKRIDLTQLMRAISAVPGFEDHLYHFLADSRTHYETLSEAAILAGRSGIRMVLCECMHEVNKRSPAVLVFVPQNTSSRSHALSTQTKSTLAEL